MASNLHDDQEALETPLSQDHRNPSFEFFRGGLSDYSEENAMSHAEDIIFCGKLIPVNQQLHLTKPPQQNEKHHRRDQQNQPLFRRRSRSESRSDVKTTTVRNSRSLGYKNLRRKSSMSSEPVHNSGKKSSSSQKHALLFGLVNVQPPEMNIRDLKNRRVRLNYSSESLNKLSFSRSVDHRKSSWRVLEFLSCKSSVGAVMTPLSYMAKV